MIGTCDHHEEDVKIKNVTQCSVINIVAQLDADITEYVKWSQACVQHKPIVPLTLMTRDIPSGPWEEIATDFLILNQKD